MEGRTTKDKPRLVLKTTKKKEQERKRRLLLHRKRERDKWSGENGI